MVPGAWVHFSLGQFEIAPPSTGKMRVYQATTLFTAERQDTPGIAGVAPALRCRVGQPPSRSERVVGAHGCAPLRCAVMPRGISSRGDPAGRPYGALHLSPK